MKTLSTIALILALFFSCKKENFDVMPPESQSGKNTFGCLIDGDLFVGGCCAPSGPVGPISVEYQKESDKLFISVYGKMNIKSISNRATRVGIVINSPQLNIKQKLFQACYYPADIIDGCWNFNTINDGMWTITRFDTINKIVSGRFQFVGHCSNDESTKQITQGRFDLKFDIINE
jgi:hypothetical protein